MIAPFEIWMIFLGGLLGSVHYLGACRPHATLLTVAFGGRQIALTVGSRRQCLGGSRSADETRSLSGFLIFTVARLSVYAGLGFAAGQAGEALAELGPRAGAFVTLASGALALALGLALLGVLPDPAALAEGAGLERTVEGGVRGLERLFGPFSPMPLPMKRALVVFILGGVQGVLPCALVLAFLTGATSTLRTDAGAAVMLAFGLGTVPTLAWASLGRRRGPSAHVPASRPEGEAVESFPGGIVGRLAGLIVVVGAARLIVRAVLALA
jgi:hypothetical protein